MTSFSSPSRVPSGIWHTYDSRQGFNIGASFLAQDREGHLWIGAHPAGGLCRYDGVDFRYFTAQDGLPGQILSFLYRDSRGRLWTGAEDGGLAIYDGLRFSPFEPPDGFPDQVSAMAEGADGLFWFIGFDGQIYGYDGKRVIPNKRDSALSSVFIHCIMGDSRNRLWFGTSKGLFWDEGNGLVSHTFPETRISSHVSTICEDAAGRIWVGGNSGIVCYDRGQFVHYQPGRELPHDVVSSIYSDRHNRIWVGGLNGGVACIQDGHVTVFTSQDGLYDDTVHGILEDTEGSLWFGHQLGGLSRFEPGMFQTLCDDPIPFYGFTRDRKGRIWFGSHDWIGCVTDEKVERRAMSAQVCDILIDSSDGLWCASTDGAVYRFSSCDAVFHEEPESFRENPSCRPLSPYCLAEERTGRILAGGTEGVYYYEDDQFLALLPDCQKTFFIHADRAGALWLVRWRTTGLIRYDGKNQETITRADGLPSDVARWIMEGRDGRLWISTIGGGICYIPADCLDNPDEPLRFVPMDFNNELQNVWISRINEDEQGRLWFSTLASGVYCYDGRNIQLFDRQDGLPSSNIIGVGQRNDGSLVIGTRKGLVLYREPVACPPPVFIREVLADQAYPGDRDIALTTIQAGRITFRFRGISFQTPRMRYSFRLEGYDPEWRATWDEETSYEDLPPGEYRFQVIAINRYLVYSDLSATIRVTIQSDPRDIAFSILQNEVAALREAVGQKYRFEQIIGQSPAMQKVYRLMEKSIDSGLTVLISGETGTGKEVVAKAIHYHSNRRDRPLQELNCGAIPKELVAAMLFGYRKGAFTGAFEDTAGLFEAADQGAILLDEIGELSAEAQVHLLRVLQEQTVQRLGETRLRQVDVRVIAATNRDLEEEVKKGRFREDLYYRLSVFPIHIPPLRERPQDIQPLVDHFLKQAGEQFSKKLGTVDAGLMDMLQRNAWPGNVRELENEIYRAAALVEDSEPFRDHHFSPRITSENVLVQGLIRRGERYTDAVNRFRKQYILSVLKECGGNRSEAAKRLDMYRPNLIALLKKFNIE